MNCPKCGQLVPPKNDTVSLLEILRSGDPHRQVYKGRDGRWYVTFGGGEFSHECVKFLVASGEIVDCYKSLPNECYHVGKTLDTEATLIARKKFGTRRLNIYSDGTEETT